jgi:hypothetical protein
MEMVGGEKSRWDSGKCVFSQISSHSCAYTSLKLVAPSNYLQIVEEPNSVPESLVYRAKAFYACQLSCRSYQVVLSLNPVSRYRVFRRSE